jgi:hypothetical protein
VTNQLSNRVLNRTLLARQGLLGRQRLAASEAVVRLGGLNGQYPTGPYLGLWARLDGFERRELAELVQQRRVVRATVLRSTIHFVAAADYARWHTALRPMLERAFRGYFPVEARSLDLDLIAARARELLAERPMSRAELGRALAPLGPDFQPDSLAFAARARLPLVQVAGAGEWEARGEVRYELAAAVIDHPLATADEGLVDLARRHLAAFGPATAQDVQAWTGLTRMRAVLDRLDLMIYRDESGRELYDLPDAPLADGASPAPPRLLPDYDNVMFAHRDRSRIVADAYRRVLVSGGRRAPGLVLLDGMVAGTWRQVENSRGATLGINLRASPSRRDLEALDGEARALARHLSATSQIENVTVEMPD